MFVCLFFFPEWKEKCIALQHQNLDLAVKHGGDSVMFGTILPQWNNEGIIQRGNNYLKILTGDLTGKCQGCLMESGIQLFLNVVRVQETFCGCHCS